MLVESVLNGAHFPFNFHRWNDELVGIVDRRYAEIINGKRINQVPLYVRPSEFEQERGFCDRTAVDVNRVRSQAVRAAHDALHEGFYLMKCHPAILSSRDKMIGKNIVVNWQGDGTWFIGRVLGLRNKSFNVKWLDDSETVIRLRHFGFTEKQGGQDWRLVSRNSDLFNIYDGHTRGMIWPLSSSPIEMIETFTDTSDIVNLFCEAEESLGMINAVDLAASEPRSQKDQLDAAKPSAILSKAEERAPTLFFVEDDGDEEENRHKLTEGNEEEDDAMMAVDAILAMEGEEKEGLRLAETKTDEQKVADHDCDNLEDKENDAMNVEEKKGLKRKAKTEKTERPAKRQKSAPKKLEDYWGLGIKAVSIKL